LPWQRHPIRAAFALQPHDGIATRQGCHGGSRDRTRACRTRSASTASNPMSRRISACGADTSHGDSGQSENSRKSSRLLEVLNAGRLPTVECLDFGLLHIVVLLEHRTRMLDFYL